MTEDEAVEYGKKMMDVFPAETSLYEILLVLDLLKQAILKSCEPPSNL